MKKLIKHIFYPNTHITEYKSIGIDADIREQVLFRCGDLQLDVSDKHWLLCLEPIVFGIWIPDDVKCNILTKGKSELLFYEKEKNGPPRLIAEASLSFLEEKNKPGGSLLLFRSDRQTILQVSRFESRFLIAPFYKKPGFTLQKMAAFAAAYSYPRRVRLISFLEGDNYNLFPMDLLGQIGGTNQIIFGLRHTNRSLEKIINTGKIVMCEFPSSYRDVIYSLGSHHSSAPPDLSALPFKVTPSVNWNFPIPEFVTSYHEIRITDTKNLGSHMLMLGESMHHEIKTQPATPLYHIHFLLYLMQKRNKDLYAPA
jgi:hypothetical protein